MRMTKRRGAARTTGRTSAATRRGSVGRVRALKKTTRRKSPVRRTSRGATPPARPALRSTKTGCVPITVIPEGSPVIKGRTLKWYIVLQPKFHEAGKLKIEVFPESAVRLPIGEVNFHKNQLVVAVDTEIVREAPLDYAVLTASIGSKSACGMVVFRPVAFP
jgi:hypothetical protein